MEGGEQEYDQKAEPVEVDQTLARRPGHVACRVNRCRHEQSSNGARPSCTCRRSPRRIVEALPDRPDRSPRRCGGVEQLCAPEGELLTQPVEALADQAVPREIVGFEQLRLGERLSEDSSVEGDVRALG